MKRLFYFATEREAAASLKLLGAKGCQECMTSGLYTCPQGYVKVGGMGVLAAAAAVGGVQWDELWNFGIAATLSSVYSLETRVVVGSVGRPSFFPEGLELRSQEWHSRLFPRLHCSAQASPSLTNASLARLVSCDYPIHQSHLADQLRVDADLLDMEGYGLAFAAYQLAKPCFIGKWVTDCASAGGPLAIQRLIDQASKHFAEWIRELLQDPPAPYLWNVVQ